MLSVLSSQQIGIRGALQDCARWNLRTGVAWRHEVLYAQYSSIRDKNRSTKSEQHMFVSWRHELNNISSSGHYWLQIDQSKCVCKSGSTSLFWYFHEANTLNCYIVQWRIPIACLFVCSTNGTVINMSKLVKKQTHMLQNGDVIYFVYRKSEPEQSELFIFYLRHEITFIWIYKKERLTVPSISCHPLDIAYVYHSIKTEQAISQHSYGE